MNTEFTKDGLVISAQDLSAINPDSEDNERMFHHDGSSSISMVGGGTTSQRGYYVWDSDSSAWHPLFHNADKLDGMESGEFVHRDGSLAMAGDLDFDHFGITNADFIESGAGRLNLNSNHATLSAESAGGSVQLADNNGLLLLDANEGGVVNVPNTLNEAGNRVATRTWTNANADVPNADYADNANQLDGYDESAFLHVSGDQMEGALDLGGFNINDSAGDITLGSNTDIGGILNVADEIHLSGDEVLNTNGGYTSILTGADGTTGVNIYSKANSQHLLKTDEDGTVTVPSGNLTLSSGNSLATKGADISTESGGTDQRIIASNDIILRTGGSVIRLKDKTTSEDMIRAKGGTGGNVEIPHRDLKLDSGNTTVTAGTPVNNDIFEFYITHGTADNIRIARNAAQSVSLTLVNDTTSNNLFKVNDSGSVEIPSGDLDISGNVSISGNNGNAYYRSEGSNSSIYLQPRDGTGSVVNGLQISGDGNVEVANGDLNVVGNSVTGDNGTSINFTGQRAQLVSGGNTFQIEDSTNSQAIASFFEGGDVSVPNGQLSEQGNRVATRTWTDNNFNTVSLSVPVTKWASGISNEEIWRMELQAGESIEVNRLEVQPKGGGDVSGLSVDVYDVSSGTVIASTSDLTTGSPVGTSSDGANCIVR